MNSGVNMKKKIILLLVMAFTASVFFASEIRFNEESKIVFNSSMNGQDDIYLLSKNQLIRLTDDPGSDQYPVANPTGDQIVFTSNRSGNYDIYLMNLQTRAVKQLTSDERDEVSPSWSADQRFVYYDLVVGSGRWRTMKLELKSGEKTPLFVDPPFKSTIVAFQNHRGDEFFFTGKVFLGWRVAKYNLKSQKYTEMATRGSCRPRISPDSSRVAFVNDEDDGLGDVFLMNSDGGNQINLTSQRSNYYDYYPCFSPDGSKIVFSSSPREKKKTAYQLYVIDLPSGKIRLIFRSNGMNSYPCWFR